MLILKRLKIKGFRAYAEKEEKFEFDNPMILIIGENHQGKSSTLNAIEWCLFGDECKGTKTGIPERKGWEIRNLNLSAKSEVYVEVALENGEDGTYKVTRQMRGSKETLKLTLPDGRILEDREAVNKLAQLIRCSFRDFMTTVYQHQEAIRAILTQDPKDRNDAIDRLLGLSEYRNILGGINDADLKKSMKEIENKWESLNQEITRTIEMRERDLEEKRKKASEKGLKKEQLNGQGALEIARDVIQQLKDFATKAGLASPALGEPEDWKNLYQFRETASREIKRFRSEMPDVKEQRNLHSKREKIIPLVTRYEQAKEKLTDAQNKLKEFVSQNGDEESISAKKTEIEEQIKRKEKELSEANAQAAAVKNAIEYLKSQEIDKRDICPVCGKETPDLLAHLEKEWEEKFKKQVEEIVEQIKELKTKSTDIADLLSEYKKLHEGLNDAKDVINAVNKQISEALDREITREDDPLAILNNELEQIERELQKQQEAIREKQEFLDGIASKLEQQQLIEEILNLEEKKKIAEQIEESPIYQEMKELRHQMSKLFNDIEKIKESIRNASHKEAEQSVTAAGDVIDYYFRRITDNPAVSKIKFSVSADSRTGSNSYEFKDQNDKDLMPILSQGDLNALALSIFLGLACSKEINAPFGFIILDDPSQSLCYGHKANLVAVLEEVLRKRMVIVATMDKELQDLLSKITKAKTTYFLTGWSPGKGPNVARNS